MKNIAGHIARLFADPFYSRLNFLFRNDEERRYLEDFIASKNAPKPVAASLSPASSCSLCPGAMDRKAGFGTGENGLMIVLNAPRYVSRVDRELYREDSVRLMKKMIEAIGLDIRGCFVTNLVKCETGDPMMTPGRMAENCQPLLLEEIGRIAPRFILVMGEIVSLQKIIHESSGIEWFSIDHPITLLNNPDQKRKAWETLKLLGKKYGVQAGS